MSKGGIVLEVLYAAVFNTELICYLIYGDCVSQTMHKQIGSV